MKRLVAFLIVFVVAVAFAADESKWITGAVTALITKEEREAFKKLKTDAERDQFIKDFWAKRDPSPGTQENEFKTKFETIAQKVNDLKIPSKKRQGIDTDMGQVLSLFGQPSEEKKGQQREAESYGREEQEAEEGAPEEPPSSAETRIWIYRDAKGISEKEIQFEYAADPGSGEWKFTDRKKAENYLEQAKQYQLQAAKSGGGAPQPEAGKAPAGAQTQPAQAPPAATTITTPALTTAIQAVASGTAPKDVPIESIADVFMSSKGEIYGTVALRTTADASTGNVGIRVLDGSGATVKEMELPFANPKESGEPGYFQAQIPLAAPGTYTVLAAVAVGDKTGAAKQTITVPDTTKLGISSIILSKKFTQLTDAQPEMEPYTFGKIKVYPSIDRTFSKSDELTMVYEVYNFTPNATTSKPDLEATVTFTSGKSSPAQTYPITGEKHLVVGKRILVPQLFPLASFPPGDWTVKLTVKDKVSGQTASADARFTLK